MNIYTQNEVSSNIVKLDQQLQLLIRQRQDLNSQILQCKKSIDYWESLDLSQIKMF